MDVSVMPIFQQCRNFGLACVVETAINQSLTSGALIAMPTKWIAQLVGR
jgi:hypothetical protein